LLIYRECAEQIHTSHCEAYKDVYKDENDTYNCYNFVYAFYKVTFTFLFK